MSVEKDLLFIAFLLNLLSTVMFWGNAFLGAKRIIRPAAVVFAVGALFNLLYAASYVQMAGRLPVASMNEFIMMLSLVVALLYAVSWFVWRLTIIGAVVAPLEVGLLSYLLISSSRVPSLVPALQSVWLQFHVLIAILAYGFFTLSFVCAVIYLFRGKTIDSEASRLMRLISQGVTWGFPFQTLVLITGAVWAEQVWGSWWSWDPKETWALITWLIYAIYLHLNRTRQWDTSKAAWMSIIGFLTVIFTLFGVTLLIPGLHSY